MKKRPIVLCILDGYGLSERIDGNAVKLANTPNIDDLEMIYPTTRIKASGMPVGLPDGQMGNSEVGHLNIGAGRIVYQSLTLINKAVEDGTFFTNEAFLKAIQHDQTFYHDPLRNIYQIQLQFHQHLFLQFYLLIL